MGVYCVVINKDESINGGERILCSNKMNALNIAVAVVRSYYNIGVQNAHIFVIENIDSIKYHYEIRFEKNAKMILFYEGFCDNRKVIARQVII